MIYVLLLIVLSLFVVACGGKKDDTSETKSDATKTGDTTKKEEVVTLKWVTVGSGMPKNYEAWKEDINKYLEEKIGVHIDVEVVSWGDWSNRRNVLVNSGESFDCQVAKSILPSQKISLTGKTNHGIQGRFFPSFIKK